MLIQRGAAVLIIEPLLPGTDRPLQADVALLERFSALMAEQGLSAHVSAMAFDRVYARERFTLARRRGDAELSTLATGLLHCLRHGRAAIPPG